MNQSEKHQAVWGRGTAFWVFDVIIYEESLPPPWGQLYQAGPALSICCSSATPKAQAPQPPGFLSMALRQGSGSYAERYMG